MRGSPAPPSKWRGACNRLSLVPLLELLGQIGLVLVHLSLILVVLFLALLYHFGRMLRSSKLIRNIRTRSPHL